MNWSFYVLRCADDSYYAGATSQLLIRVAEHNEGVGSKYVRSRRPATVIFVLRGLDKCTALSIEAKFKRLSSRLAKEKFMSLTGNLWHEIAPIVPEARIHSIV
jgi:putative endonuclease